ncbi:DUF6868 family protein [Nitrosomonas sp.]|uniref:DUF6868 family protein n=1 Tax=Nitrosomonas sp. TaxID=42353 RepID=UPI0035CD3C84
MDSIELITEFFGWCIVINTSILISATIFLVLMRDSISNIHGRMFMISEENLSRAYFQYLAHYKIAIFSF